MIIHQLSQHSQQLMQGVGSDPVAAQDAFTQARHGSPHPILDSACKMADSIDSKTLKRYAKQYACLDRDELTCLNGATHVTKRLNVERHQSNVLLPNRNYKGILTPLSEVLYI